MRDATLQPAALPLFPAGKLNNEASEHKTLKNSENSNLTKKKGTGVSTHLIALTETLRTKMKILPSFTHPDVVPKTILFSMKYKRR